MRIQRLAIGVVVALTWTVAIDAAFAGNGRKALGILPHDTVGVFVINIDRFEGSPYYADAMAFFRTQTGLTKNVDGMAASGALDLEKDVDAVVIGIPSQSDSDAGVMIFEGRFDARKLAKAAAAGDEKFSKAKHRGVAYWSRDGGAFALVGTRFVATKSKKRLQAVIDAYKKKKKSAAKSKALKGLIKHVDTTKDMWLVLDASVLKGAVPLDADGITGSADLASGLKLTIDLLMPTKQKADDLKAQLDIGKKTVANQPLVAPLLSNVTVTQSGTEVVVNAAFDDAQLQIIGTLMSKMGGRTF